MKKQILTSLVALCLITGAGLAQAHSMNPPPTQVSVGHHQLGWYSEGQTLQYSFPQPTYVENMIVSAIGNNRYAEAQVFADGEYIALLGVPGRDPNYPVIVRKKVSSIRISFLGSIKIQSLVMYTNLNGSGRWQSSQPTYATNETAYLASRAQEVVSSLQDNILDGAFRDKLIPIRKAAIKLFATATAYQEYLPNTKPQIDALVAAIDNAQTLFDEMMYSKGAYNEDVQELLVIKETLLYKQQFPGSPNH